MVQMSRPPTVVERAERLLEVFGAAGDESVSRINELLQLGGGPGHQGLAERRRWAEAWQLLEAARLICREPDDRRGSSWFLTGAGRQALSGGGVEGAPSVRGMLP